MKAITVALMVGERAACGDFTLGALCNQLLKWWLGTCRDSMSCHRLVGMAVNQVLSCAKMEAV